MSINLVGFWVPKDSWPRARELAMMYTWRYHNIMRHVKEDIEIFSRDESTFSFMRYKTTRFVALAEDYHADPDFVTAQLFHCPGPNFFMLWLDYSAGYTTETMVGELMLPWTPVEYFSITGSTRNISVIDGLALGEKVNRDRKDRAYLLSPILQYDDPVNAHGFDLWPSCIREFKDMEILLHGGVEAPLPVYHEFDENGLDIEGQPV